MRLEESRRRLSDYVFQYAGKMFNAPGETLKRPFLEPGGAYTGNLWDWDSYWTSVALLGIADDIQDPKRRREFKENALLHAKGSLLTFFDYQWSDGSMPILLVEGNPDFFNTRNPSQNLGKPVQAQFASLLDEHGELSSEERKTVIHGLRRLAECRINRSKSSPSNLYVWNSDAAIGVDDDPAAWGRPPRSSAHIYLNSLIYADLRSAAELAGKWGFQQEERFFAAQAEELLSAIRSLCFDLRDGLYYSVDVQCETYRPKFKSLTLNENLEPFWLVMPLKIGSWCSFLPLWCGIASPEEAESMVKKHLLKEERFWTNYGIRSLAADEKMYSPEVSRGNPSNWLGPIWIIACFMTWKGLKRYGFEKEASLLAGNTLSLLANDLERSGLIHEYYSPETGLGICGPGFLNWNLLALLMK